MSKSKYYYMIMESNIGVKLYSSFYPNLFLVKTFYKIFMPGMYPQGRPVAPKFSDTLTLSQLRGGRFCPPSQRSQLTFFHDYVPE